MKAIVTLEVEDKSTREDMAKAGITDQFVKNLYIAAFDEILSGIVEDSGSTARVVSVQICDNIGEEGRA